MFTAGEEFLLLACDGLWDVLEAEQVVAFVANHLEEGKDTSETAKALVKHAIRLGSGDNISLIVVFFKDKQRAVRSRQRELALQRKAASETAAQGSTDSNAPTSSS
jgi:serine/threonine protein phosphatase PrpC